MLIKNSHRIRNLWLVRLVALTNLHHLAHRLEAQEFQFEERSDELEQV